MIKLFKSIAIIVIASVVCMPVPALAQGTALTNSGNWFTAANWNNGVPTVADDAAIGFDLAAGIGASGAAASSLYVGLSTGSGQLDIGAGDLTVSNLVLAWGAGAGDGTINHSAGTVTVNAKTAGGFGMANDAGSSATYTITGGSLDVNNLVGGNLYPDIANLGTATWNVSNGASVHFGIFRPYFARGSTGHATVNMSGGTFIIDNNTFAQDGYFELNLGGGTFQTGNSQMGRNVGSTGIVNITGGNFSPNSMHFGYSGGHAEINVSDGTWSRGAFDGGGGEATLRISGTNGVVTWDRHVEFGANDELHLELDGGITEIYHNRDKDDRTIALGGTLRISLLSGGIAPTNGEVITVFRTHVNGSTFDGETFDTVLWEDGLGGDVVYDYADHEVRLENIVIPEPISIGLIIAGIGAFCYRRLRMTWKAREG